MQLPEYKGYPHTGKVIYQNYQSEYVIYTYDALAKTKNSNNINQIEYDRLYGNKSDAFIVAYDKADQSSVKQAIQWIEAIKKYNKSYWNDTRIYLVGLALDQNESAQTISATFTKEIESDPRIRFLEINREGQDSISRIYTYIGCQLKRLPVNMDGTLPVSPMILPQENIMSNIYLEKPVDEYYKQNRQTGVHGVNGFFQIDNKNNENDSKSCYADYMEDTDLPCNNQPQINNNNESSYFDYFNEEEKQPFVKKLG